MIIDSHCHLNYEPMSLSLKDTKILKVGTILKKSNILFKKIENDN